jgi:hypothetical protein
MAIKKESWREQTKVLAANTVDHIDFLDTSPNTIQIRNMTAGSLYLSESPALSTSLYEMIIIPSGTRIYTTGKKTGVKTLYLLSSGDGSVLIKSAESDELYPADFDETMQTTIINAVIPASVTLAAALPAGTNNIGKVVLSDGNDDLIIDAHKNIGAVLKDSAGDPIGVAGNPLEANVSVTVGAVTVDWPGSPQITSVSMTNADTEYSVDIPANCRSMRLAVREGDYSFTWRMAFETGKVAAKVEPYRSYNGGIEYDPGAIKMSATPGTIYFACSEAGHVMEVEFWT